MGWLFAVARGLQEEHRKALVQALFPIALGHAASIALTVALIAGLQVVTSPRLLRPVIASVLVAFGLWRLWKPGWHPRWVGMRVTLPELALWSFLMSSAHGAGLMLFPVLLRLPGGDHGHHAGPIDDSIVQGTAAVVVHTLAMWLVMSVVAIAVYEKLGLAVLRRGWVNLDLLWALAFLVAGVFTLLG